MFKTNDKEPVQMQSASDHVANHKKVGLNLCDYSDND